MQVGETVLTGIQTEARVLVGTTVAVTQGAGGNHGRGHSGCVLPGNPSVFCVLKNHSKAEFKQYWTKPSREIILRQNNIQVMAWSVFATLRIIS